MEKIKVNPIVASNGKGFPRSHRESLLMDVKKLIDKQREFEGYKKTSSRAYEPVDFMAIKIKTSHLDDFDLAWHIQECKKTSNFSKAFFGRLKNYQSIVNEAKRLTVHSD